VNIDTDISLHDYGAYSSKMNHQFLLGLEFHGATTNHVMIVMVFLFLYACVYSIALISLLLKKT